MLTIIAWLIFIPALFWNTVLFTVAVMDIFDSKSKMNWKNYKNLITVIVSLAFLFVPGIYLFGVW